MDNAKQVLKIFPKPAWWKNDLGMDHSVPSPWTPVKATEKGYGVWGRDYQFQGGVFPKQIINQGKPLLKATPRLIVQAGGQQTDLVAAASEPPKQDAQDHVELKSAVDAGGVSARIKGTLDFDGCCRLDLTLTPKGADKLDALTLELSLPREIGQFLFTSNGSSGSVTEIKGEYKGLFVPSLWVGNDDMGLSFFTESDQYWNPRDAGAVQIVPTADTTLLRINFVRAPLALKGPITYSFALMASPVRPVVDGDPFVWNDYQGPAQVVYPENLTYPCKDLTNSAEGTLDFWARKTQPGEAGSAAEVFNILPADSKAGFIRCLSYGNTSVAVDVNEKRLLDAKVGLSGDAFSHVALVWTAKSVSLYVDGKRAATAESTEAFRKVMAAAAQPDGRLIFGDRSDYYSSPAVDVDDIRVSSKARYEGESYATPTGPLAKDADTRLLDPLDETFVPDGQDALTAAGGCPSIGCSFIDGKFGKALRIQVGPARTAEEIIKDLGANFSWDWEWTQECPPVLLEGVGPNLDKLVATSHKYGLKRVPYFVYPAIGSPSAFAQQWQDEWAIKPLSIIPWPPEGHFMVNCNLSSRRLRRLPGGRHRMDHGQTPHGWHLYRRCDQCLSLAEPLCRVRICG